MIEYLSKEFIIIDNDGEKGLKRILTITPYTIGDTHALGITMEKFFHNCDISNIYQLYFYEENKARKRYDNEYCYNYFWYINRNKENKQASTKNIIMPVKARFTARLRTSIKEMLPVVIPASLLKRIDLFEPEVIYVQLYGMQMIKLVEKIRKRYQIPLVVHMMDDWIETAKENRVFEALYERQVKRMLRSLLRKSTYVYGAAPAMCDYLLKEYGADAEFVMPYTEFPQDCPVYKSNSSIIRFAYTGNIEGGRHSVIIMLLNALDNLGVEYHLDVYTRQEEYLSNYRNEHLTVHGAVPQREVESILDSADGLIHVESFDEDKIKWAKYSLSTKIPEYLASGRPIFYLGPEEVGVGDFLNRGFAECDENASRLALRIREFYKQNDELIYEITKKRFNRAKKILSEKEMGNNFSRWYV